MVDALSDSIFRMIRSLDRLRDASDKMIVAFYRLDFYSNKLISAIRDMDVGSVASVPVIPTPVVPEITSIPSVINASEVTVNAQTANIYGNKPSDPPGDPPGDPPSDPPKSGKGWLGSAEKILDVVNKVAGTANDVTDLWGKVTAKIAKGKNATQPPTTQSSTTQSSIPQAIAQDQTNVFSQLIIDLQQVRTQQVVTLYAQNLIISNMPDSRRSRIDVTPKKQNPKSLPTGKTPNKNLGFTGAPGGGFGSLSGFKGGGGGGLAKIVGLVRSAASGLGMFNSPSIGQVMDQAVTTASVQRPYDQIEPAVVSNTATHETEISRTHTTSTVPEPAALVEDTVTKASNTTDGFKFGNILKKGKDLLKVGAKALGPLNLVATAAEIATAENKPKAILSAVTSTGLAVAGNIFAPGVGGLAGGLMGQVIGDALGNMIFKDKKKGKEKSNVQVFRESKAAVRSEQQVVPLYNNYAINNSLLSQPSTSTSNSTGLSNQNSSETNYNINIDGVHIVMPKEEIDEESLAKRIGMEIVSKMRASLDNRVVTP